MNNKLSIIIIASILLSISSLSQAQISRQGWQAELSTLAHGVSGTVTIIDEDTIQVNNFNYDGGGLLVYFYLGVDATRDSFTNGLEIGPNLLGTVYNNATLTIDLPPGKSTSDYNAISVWCTAVGVSFGTGTFACPEQTAQYKVTFTGTWNPTDHPTNYPSNAHFSGIIGATHNDSVALWTPYTLSSPGVEQVAETGGKTIFTGEINQAISSGTAFSLISGSGLPDGYNVSISQDFAVSSCFPLVTLISMVAPTPDWFVGVHDLPLYENGKWRDRVVVPLYPWDAGTEDGTAFSTSNPATSPQQINYRLAEFPFEQTTEPIEPLAWYVFERVGACPFPLPEDVNSDCIVNLDDFSAIAANWLLNCTGTPPYDLNCF